MILVLLTILLLGCGTEKDSEPTAATRRATLVELKGTYESGACADLDGDGKALRLFFILDDVVPSLVYKIEMFNDSRCEQPDYKTEEHYSVTEEPAYTTAEFSVVRAKLTAVTSMPRDQARADWWNKKKHADYAEWKVDEGYDELGKTEAYPKAVTRYFRFALTQTGELVVSRETNNPEAAATETLVYVSRRVD